MQEQANVDKKSLQDELTIDETVKMVKERDQKLGRLISTMSSSYPVLQVMGYRKLNNRNEVEVEPTSINIFDIKKMSATNGTP